MKTITRGQFPLCVCMCKPSVLRQTVASVITWRYNTGPRTVPERRRRAVSRLLAAPDGEGVPAAGGIGGEGVTRSRS